MTRNRDCPTCYATVAADAAYCDTCDTFLLPHRRLGDILLEQGVVTDAQLEESRVKQKKLGEILVEGGHVSKDIVENAMAVQKRTRLELVQGYVRRRRLKRVAYLGLALVVALGLMQWDKLMKLEELRVMRQLDHKQFQNSLLTDRLILTAINWLKSGDPKTVETCWNLLKTATNQNLPKDAKVWEQWYATTHLPGGAQGSGQPR